MKRKSTSQSARVLIALLVCGAAWSIVTGMLATTAGKLAFFRTETPAGVSHPAATALTFAERVSYQRAIEEVFWRHRVWPNENRTPKPPLDTVMSQAQLENKVASYLRDSLTLEDHGKPITAEQLQAEMERMARDTKQSQVLRELFEALGNDPAVIAECLARPILAARLIADFSEQDESRHVESPQIDALRATSVVTSLGQAVYTLPEIADAGDPPCADDTWTPTTTTNAPVARAFHTAVWTGSEMIVWGGSAGGTNYLNTGARYNPSTDSWAAISTTNAPSGRQFHTAVWTGTEMIVWGGYDNVGGEPNSGGRYNPSTDSWTATNTTNAPIGRWKHTAVWTGSEMIVWGGRDEFQVLLKSGGDTIPEQIVGQQLALQTRPLPETLTRRCGLAVK